MVRVAAMSVVLSSYFLAGCLDASSSVAATSYPTTLTVQPASFRGTIDCGAAGLHRYVVTLSDVTAGDSSLGTLRSAPTVCTAPTSFSLERGIGHAFIATIDGYDRDDIAPAAPGSREMLDVASGARVCPAWQASCGALESAGNPLRQPTSVVELTETFMTGCTPLVPITGDCAAADDGGATVTDGGAFDASGPPGETTENHFLDGPAQVLDDGTREGG